MTLPMHDGFDVADEYLAGHHLDDDPALDAALAANAAAGLPAIDVSPLQGRFLTLLVRLMRARRILELGTLGGYSSICLARGLPADDPDARLISLELRAAFADVARRNIERAGLGDRVEIRVGPALDGLASLRDEAGPPFDLVFIDADKARTADYAEQALALTRPGSLIVADNVVRDGTVLDDSGGDESTVGVRRFHELVDGHPRLTSTVLQTVGVKGWDGIAFAIVEP